MEDSIAAWEGEGGSASSASAGHMIGTPLQIAWALQIKSQVEAEFDRVRRVLEYAAAKRSPENVADIQAIIRILEDKRAEVLENEQAGYFIHDWQEPRDLVSRMIMLDPRYEAIKVSQAARFQSQVAREQNRDPAKPSE